MNTYVLIKYDDSKVLLIDELLSEDEAKEKKQEMKQAGEPGTGMLILDQLIITNMRRTMTLLQSFFENNYIPIHEVSSLLNSSIGEYFDQLPNNQEIGLHQLIITNMRQTMILLQSFLEKNYIPTREFLFLLNSSIGEYFD